MGRYIKEIRLNQPIDVVSMVMDDFVYHNRFRRSDWNGEMVFFLKDSHGRERYMKWSYAGGLYHVEAWLKGAFGKEMDLDGVGGGASRQEYRRCMDELIGTLKRQTAAPMAGGHVGSDPIHHESGQGSNHETWKRDTQWQPQTGRSASAPAGNSGRGSQRTAQRSGGAGTDSGMMFAILAMIVGCMIPIMGIVLAVCALKKSESDGQRQQVRTFAIIALVLSAAAMLIGFFVRMSSLLAFG